jgi:hypothetical protein
LVVDFGSRRRLYIKNGCNAISHGGLNSPPMGFWLEKDVWGIYASLISPILKLTARIR